jgi:amino acid transporter
MIDKYEILSIVAPIASPAAPATMLINILYADLTREAVSSNFAMFAAVASGIGAEASGMIAAYVGVQAYRKRKYGLMIVAIIAFVAYASFMALGISAAKQPMTMISMIVISIIAYLAVATFTDLRGSSQDEYDTANMQISLINAEKNKINAETRNAKVNGFVHANSTRTSNAIVKLSDEKIAEIREYWTDHPAAKYRDVAIAVGCAPSTAMKYKP